MSIEVCAITKKYRRFPALEDVTFRVESGELVALLGPSGSGKTTLLRTIAGLEFPDDATGRVLFDDTDVTQLAAYKRRAGFVFQHYALFSHLSVFENVAFGLRVMKSVRHPSQEEIEKRVLALLEGVQLGGYEKRLPSQLSGGQRQRVAFARALAIEPRVLLLDEPFGALDTKVRRELRRWLREFQSRIQITTLFVTHDQDEAFEIADRIVLIDQGRIQQIGTPAEVRAAPSNRFVAEFLDLPWTDNALTPP